MKRLFFITALITIGFIANAQSPFKPKPLPTFDKTHSLELGAASAPLTQNFWRPVVGITASVSNGSALAGGFGISYQHNKWDSASQSWAIQYAFSGVAFIGSSGTKVTGIGGIVISIPGTNGIISLGPGYDFTQKQLVFLTGVTIPL
jgi:hypothetical protein